MYWIRKCPPKFKHILWNKEKQTWWWLKGYVDGWNVFISGGVPILWSIILWLRLDFGSDVRLSCHELIWTINNVCVLRDKKHQCFCLGIFALILFPSFVVDAMNLKNALFECDLSFVLRRRQINVHLKHISVFYCVVYNICTRPQYSEHILEILIY